MTIDSSKISFGMGGSSGAPSIETIPFRLLAVGDFSREGRGMGEEIGAKTFRVDQDSFDELFGKLNPRLLIEVPNVLLAKGEPVVADLEFKSLKDFQGAAVVRQVPALAALHKLREDISRQAAPDDTPAALADKIQTLSAGIPFAQELIDAVRSSGGASPGAAKPGQTSKPASGSKPASDVSVDSILDMMEEGTDEAEEARKGVAEGAISSAISSMFKSSKPSGTSKAQKTASAAAHAWFDETIGKQLDQILHHPEFQSMESAWRGLRFLIERTDFRKEIVVEVLAGRKQDLRRVLIEEVLQEEYNSPGDPPLAAILCDVAFDNSTPDIDLLNEIALKCESIQAPIITQASSEFFGRKALQAVAGLGSLYNIFQGEPYTKWRALREKEETRWLALTTNRFLARPAAAGGTEGKTYPEAADEARGEGLLWVSSVWALGSCMTQSFARDNWPHFLSGIRGGGAVENLPLRNAEPRMGKVVPTPLEAVFNEAQSQDLASAGFIPLRADEGSDTAYFTFLPCVFAPKKYSNPQATQEAALHAILPYQLFAGRISLWMSRLLGPLRGSASAEELQQRLEQGLRAVLTKPGESPEATRTRVEVTDDEKNPMRYQVCMEIHPSFKFFGLTPRLLLAVSVPR